MTKFEAWFIGRVVAREVLQGQEHSKNIEALYALIRDKCEKEFTEDNALSMDQFLQERFDTTKFNTTLQYKR